MHNKEYTSVEMILFQLLRQCLALPRLVGSTSCSQDQATEPYPDPAEANRKPNVTQ
jgi:hypothetical protein